MADSAGPTRLPGRDEMIERIGSLLGGDRRAAVLAVEVAGFDGLRALDEQDAHGVVREVETRLDRLVRGRDALGFVPPDRFLLGCADLDLEDAGALVERIRGGVALPIDLAGAALSLTLHVGVAFSSDGADGTSLIDAAEADMVRSRPKG